MVKQYDDDTVKDILRILWGDGSILSQGEKAFRDLIKLLKHDGSCTSEEKEFEETVKKYFENDELPEKD